MSNTNDTNLMTSAQVKKQLNSVSTDNLDVKNSIYLTTGAVEVPKDGKWQLYVDSSGTLWLSGINGMLKRQVAFV